jgi:hypothetical protein
MSKNRKRKKKSIYVTFIFAVVYTTPNEIENIRLQYSCAPAAKK